MITTLKVSSHGDKACRCFHRLIGGAGVWGEGVQLARLMQGLAVCGEHCTGLGGIPSLTAQCLSMASVGRVPLLGQGR